MTLRRFTRFDFPWPGATKRRIGWVGKAHGQKEEKAVAGRAREAGRQATSRPGSDVDSADRRPHRTGLRGYRGDPRLGDPARPRAGRADQGRLLGRDRGRARNLEEIDELLEEVAAACDADPSALD